MELLCPAVTLNEYQAIGCRCGRCGRLSRGQIPPEILKSVCGPRLSAAMTYLVGNALVSRRKVLDVLDCVLQAPLSLGSLFAREAELSQALQEPYEQLKQETRDAPVKYVDETSWKRAAGWLWAVAAATVVVFACTSSRSWGELRRLLGKKLHGCICSDRYSVYAHYPKRQRGLCWAHLERDFQRWVDRGGESAKIGWEALAVTGEVFERWRLFKRRRLSRRQLKQALRPLRRQLKAVLERGAACAHPKTARTCRRLLKLWGPMWRFASVPGLEPTNNLIERMLRQAVLWRKRSFGCQSRHGCRFVERFLSVSMTLELRQQDVLEYLTSAIAAHRAGLSAPPVPTMN